MLQKSVSLAELSANFLLLPIWFFSRYWIICVIIIIALLCLIAWCWFTQANVNAHERAMSPHELVASRPSSYHRIFNRFNPRDIFWRISRRHPMDSASRSADLKNDMSYPHQASLSKETTTATTISHNFPRETKQPFEAFLILDVEATCHRGTDFNFPNEIIVSEEKIVHYAVSCQNDICSLSLPGISRLFDEMARSIKRQQSQQIRSR
jgi:hypothetical protein